MDSDTNRQQAILQVSRERHWYDFPNQATCWRWENRSSWRLVRTQATAIVLHMCFVRTPVALTHVFPGDGICLKHMLVDLPRIVDCLNNVRHRFGSLISSSWDKNLPYLWTGGTRSLCGIERQLRCRWLAGWLKLLVGDRCWLLMQWWDSEKIRPCNIMFLNLVYLFVFSIYLSCMGCKLVEQLLFLSHAGNSKVLIILRFYRTVKQFMQGLRLEQPFFLFLMCNPCFLFLGNAS